MEMEKRLEEVEQTNAELKKEIDFLKFRIELVATKSNANQILYEYDVNREQYNAIMDLMEDIRKALDEHKEYTHGTFEEKISAIFSNEKNLKYDYHFAEAIAQAFMEDGRWKEVFPALYGSMPKHQYCMGNGK